ncbi:MAG: GDPmannose 4,6-dehydratase, partial [Thermoleophilaceae bacterium]|nr:GDPmannose 4,6-dehydratase [Thermoleophilaceae bacterium]
MAPVTSALITGISGQDGSYLAELLIGKGYDLHGLVRDPAADHPNLAGMAGNLTLHEGDLRDEESLRSVISAAGPDEVYNLAAFSSVGRSWDEADAVEDANAVGVERLLRAVEELRPSARLFQASSSTMFGSEAPVPQNEDTPVDPGSPYARAKARAHALVGEARARGMHASAGILFNHESPRRGPEFVTRKITRAVAAIKLGDQSGLQLGSLDARRDWGFAGDYVKAMWLMLQRADPVDLVIGSGASHSVGDFVDAAFAYAGLDPADHVSLDPDYVRPAEIAELRADPSRAREELGWTATTGFEELVAMMVEADLEELG